MKYKLEIADRKGDLIAKIETINYDVLEAMLEVLKEKGLVEEADAE